MNPPSSSLAAVLASLRTAKAESVATFAKPAAPVVAPAAPALGGALSGAIAKLRDPSIAEQAALKSRFPLGLRTQRRKDLLKERDKKIARKLMRAENAAPLIEAFPEADGDSTHAWIPGDFVFGDILPLAIRRHGTPSRLDLVTLSLSILNVKTLEKLLADYPKLEIRLALSLYFQSTSKEIFRALAIRLGRHPRFKIAIGRIHAKIVLFHIPGIPLVIESSANLRSSNCIETVSVHRCPELFAFHAAFLNDFHALCEASTHDGFSGINPEEFLDHPADA